MTLLTSILIFVITFIKSIFDLFVSPYLFKNELSCKTTIEAAEKKRALESKSTTAVFVMVAIVSGINLWGTAVSTTESDVKNLQDRVAKIEKLLYPPDGSPDITAQLEEVIDSIEMLEKEIITLSSSKAEKTDLDKVVKILAQLQPVLESLKSKSIVRTMEAER
ncbi:hypothetical protein [Marinomonas mediterranea]|jgi:hypothetical protein|uniref:Uncharacterized protein n=1 Tax=Marinomonas mediterranea (strain ATCC 700492 / JCM 21426 / NBRC 103028 / MMB-1) TaxID=717774 RepID=F2JWJ4_MARM1|nr:hypothetical protein [Marinomonas mediterranea]ADZ90667.1 hypothetical protein Marme_1395 [Marinomonas mediterranea MMB-1]WCN08714.1 hypothetical protein GV055_07095 [Marinomonas mediterranea]WCN12762.1 hypothetical protein GV054_06895 [Marinomonas mediterranea]WCN16833.1 hypothetical protein GV053_07035 [Marinomonas mediterranea MMB-1]